MRITYRTKDNFTYWTNRWTAIPADLPMVDKTSYPLKFAELVVKSKNDKILEAGCGAGRIVRHYHNNGYSILGMDFIPEAIEKLRVADPSLNVVVGDITNLDFPSESFDVVLAFGLYHNLEVHLEQAITETRRVLISGGILCASFRADNFQTRFSDWLSNKRSDKDKKSYNESKMFHKLNLSKNELVNLFSYFGFKIYQIENVVNMPIFYKFRIFRQVGHKDFNEHLGRAEGYKLSTLGNFLQKLAMRLLPGQFCNIYVILATAD
jgi:ubiquinone/menaquinone biosynthesis C-methylase UbiE